GRAPGLRRARARGDPDAAEEAEEAVRLLICAVVVALGGRAAAQSTRYPPPQEDLDEERDSYSQLWEDAIEPGLAKYTDLVERARKRLDPHTSHAAGERSEAYELLAEAVELLPAHADAYAWRGLAREQDSSWQACADDLGQAWTLDPDWALAPRPLGTA